MKKRLEKVRLYCFSPGSLCGSRDALELVAAQIRGGADVIQMREKNKTKWERLEFGLEIKRMTEDTDTLFIVNDDVDLAMALDADGVHLGQDDLPIQFARRLTKDKIIGVSTHSLEQAKEAVGAGADYIGVGPVFETSTKKDRDPLVGLDLISRVGDVCSIPYIAIGGIGKENMASLINAGCRRAAVISDILLAENPEEQCRLLKSMLTSV